MQLADVAELPLATLRAGLAAAGWKLYFDVSPLFDHEWTGIPMVAAGLVQALLDLPGDDTRCFFRHHLVATAAVRDALARESGLYLARDFHQGHANAGAAPMLAEAAESIGIYPSVKLVPSLFAVECSLYHDISTFMLPQYHTSANIDHHVRGMIEDIRTNAVTFGVSQATVDDMVCYLEAPREATFVVRNGVSWPWWFPIEAANEGPIDAGPYFLALGTREPRKNLALIWRALEMFPELLDRARLYVVGKKGWIAQDADTFPWIKELIAARRIELTGYVSNFEKYRLLRDAAATIYPSLFEGFGLPVLESLSVGTPCIASWSSAIPEVGGDVCRYFDPLSAEDLAARLFESLEAVRDPARPDTARPDTARPGTARPDFARRDSAARGVPRPEIAHFTWTNMLRDILARLVAALPREVARHPA